MADRDQVPRQLIVADPYITGESVLRVSRTTTAAGNQQAGLTLDQPDPEASTLVGDIRPTLSGRPERTRSGTILVGEGGATGNGRWSWSRDGDDTDVDFRFRQKPSVVGKRPDCLAHALVGPPWWNEPEARVLADGRVLLLFMEQTSRYYDHDVAVGWSTSWKYAWLDPETDTWTNPALVTGLGDWDYTGTEISAGPYWTGFDFVVYPDTGEVVAVVVGGYVSTGNPHESVGAVYTSTDSGATWRMRSRILTSGVNPTLVVDAFGEEFKCCAAELTETGRLCVLLSTSAGIYAMASDDRGKTWSGQQLDDGWLLLYQSTDAAPVGGVERQAMSMRRMRNGTLLAYHQRNAERISTGAPVSGFFYLSIDGATWTEIEHDTDPYHELMDVAIVERPDGFPWMYGTIHTLYPSTYSGGAPAPVQLDELVQVAIARRDPEPTTSIDTLCPSGGAFNVHFMHLLVDAGQAGVARPNAPAGLYTTIDTPYPTIDGFANITAVRYRGQVLVIATTLNENDTEQGLVVYRVDFAQPMQERMEPKLDFFGLAGRRLAGYYRTWDCYADPNNWGFTRVFTGGGGVITVPNAEGGYWASTAAAVQNYWTDTTLPFAASSFTGVVRSVLRVTSGGSTTTPDVALLMVLGDGAGNFAGWVVKFEVSGSDLLAQLADAHGGDIGSGATITDGKDVWVEVLVGMWEITGSSTIDVEAYWRPYDRDNDPDWLVGYTPIGVGTLTTTTSSTERASFGHISSNSTGDADWKSFHIWRKDGTVSAGPSVPDSPLIQRPTTYRDEEAESVRIDRGQHGINNDAGTYNYLRPAQMIRYPAQFMTDGVRVEWRGEAIADGEIGWLTRYIYAGAHLFDESTPQREWRSNDDGVQIEIVLDAELTMGTGGVFDFDAVAVFGKNWHTFRVELNSTDSWGTPDFSVRAGVPGVLTPPAVQRHTHLFDAIAGATATIVVSDHRCRVVTAAAAARDGYTFRPHRFASKESGPRYYAVFIDAPSEGQHAVFRIADNDRDTLFFYTDPISYGVPGSATRVAIFSDRVAWDLRTAIRAAYPSGLARRYARIVIEATDHADPDEDFSRAGMIILGTATKLGPGIEYGYTVAPASGNVVTVAPTGASFRQRNHAEIRTWTLDSPGLPPAKEPTARSNANLEQGRQSWQRVVDLLRRLEVDGDVAALVFDGIAAESDPDAAGELLLTDPYDCAPVRVSSAGSAQQLGYMGRERPELGTGTGTHCVPRPVAAVRRIALTEVL